MIGLEKEACEELAKSQKSDLDMRKAVEKSDIKTKTLDYPL